MKVNEIPLVRQMKGTTYYSEDEVKNFLNTYFTKGYCWTSTKLDGRYTQIYKVGNQIFIMTSGKIRLRIPHVESQLKSLCGDWFIEAELTWGKGYLGQRDETAKQATWIKNGVVTEQDFVGFTLNIFRAMEIKVSGGKFKYQIDNVVVPGINEQRLVGSNLFLPEDLPLVYHLPMLTEEVIHLHHNLGLNDRGEGLVEGVMTQRSGQSYLFNKRVKSIGKLKPLLLTEAEIVTWLEGEGKFVGRIGSLVVETEDGYLISIGGIPDSWRIIKNFHKIKGRTLTIQYERFKDNYIQPRIYKGYTQE